MRTGLSIITGFFLKKNNNDGKYIHCFLPYIVIVGIEPVANSFLFFLYNSITLLFLLKSKTDSTINPDRVCAAVCLLEKRKKMGCAVVCCDLL